jgi:sugar-specific transcriptional regulator TrmB
MDSRLSVDEKEVAALQRLGLTEYESKIYLVLVKRGPIKASEISFFGQVPRTKTYGAINELERKGLLRIIPGKPETYCAASPNEVLLPMMGKLNRELKDSELVVQQLNFAFESSKYVKRDIPKEAGEFWQIDGRQNLYNKLNQILNDSVRSIKYATTAAGLIRIYKTQSELLERAKKNGAVVRVLAPITSENSGVAEQLSEIIETKLLERPFVANFVSVDCRELVVVDSRPDDLRTDRGSDLAIWTTNKLLVELHDQLFDRVWDSLPNLQAAKPGERSAAT